MSDFNVLKYERVIRDILNKLRVKRPDRDDMSQECYVALLEEKDHLESAEDDMGYAAILCQNKVKRLLGEKTKADSLDDPRFSERVQKIASGMDVSDEKLYGAIQAIPVYEEYQIIYSIFVDGLSEEKTGKELGLSRWAVNRRKEKGIAALQKYFKENV